MCLLDRVLTWNEKTIHCSSLSHTREDNPLLNNKLISSVHAVEYGAQAMAVHGGLLARESGQAIGSGYLVSMRNIKLNCKVLNDMLDEIDIFAAQLINNSGNLVYDFEVKNKQKSLVSGRVTVMQIEPQS